MCLDSVRGWSATSSGPWGPPRRRSGVPGPPLSGGGRTSRSGFSAGSQRREGVRTLSQRKALASPRPREGLALGKLTGEFTDSRRERGLSFVRVFVGMVCRWRKRASWMLNTRRCGLWFWGTSRCSGLQPLGPPHRPWPRPPLNLGRGVLRSPLPAWGSS